MDLSKLKEALDKGEIFDGVDEINKITKNSEGIDDLDNDERRKILDARNERAKNDMDNLSEDEIKEIKADSDIRMEKRFEAEKNEMELAEISVLTDENIATETYMETLMEQANDLKRKINSNDLRIIELKEIIEKNK